MPWTFPLVAEWLQTADKKEQAHYNNPWYDGCLLQDFFQDALCFKAISVNIMSSLNWAVLHLSWATMQERPFWFQHATPSRVNIAGSCNLKPSHISGRRRGTVKVGCLACRLAAPSNAGVKQPQSPLLAGMTPQWQTIGGALSATCTRAWRHGPADPAGKCLFQQNQWDGSMPVVACRHPDTCYPSHCDAKITMLLLESPVLSQKHLLLCSTCHCLNNGQSLLMPWASSASRHLSAACKLGLMAVNSNCSSFILSDR